MSTDGIAIPIFARGEGTQAPRTKHPLVRFYERYTPSQGWATFVFLLALLVVMGDSVEVAGWVQTPGIIAILFYSLVVGLVLSKIKLPAIFLHLGAMIIGAFAVYWQILAAADEESLQGASQETWERLSIWYEAATSDGISTDLLPFTFGLFIIAWLIGYFSSWFTFRSNNVWIAVVLAGTAILTNLSFLPERFGSRFFLFMFFAMLLVVRMSVIQRQDVWRKAGIQFNLANGWLTIHAAFWFSLLVLIVAAMLPLKVWVSPTLASLWRTGREPVEQLEEHFARLFAGVPSQKEAPGRFFGDALPFIGKISFGGEVVFWANTEYPSYWLSRTYSDYSSQGWRAGETTELEVGPTTVSPPRTDSLERVSVDQTLQLSFATNDFLAGGSLDWLSHDAVLETLSPKKFEIDLRDFSNDYLFPDDVQDVALALRREVRQPIEPALESRITRALPSDLVLDRIVTSFDDLTEQEVLDWVVLARKETLTPEIVSWKFSDRLEVNNAYSMVSYVSLATDENLREAEAEYSTFITDHYTQLPASLPDRVREKAEELTLDAETPLDKAVAIQNYLRSDAFVYSQDIEAPPRGSDGVDHFLFETKTGYSDYFASSMTVLLRSVDVPARLAAGYAPGEYNEEEGRRMIRDFDSHGWVQVYFPKYGWIDFEPTPKWPEHERRFITGPGSELFTLRGPLPITEDESEFTLPFDEAAEIGASTGDGGGLGISFDVVGFVTRAGIGVGSVLSLWLMFFVIWNWGLWSLSPVEKTYAKMSRLGRLAGIGLGRNQTPTEYALAVGNVLEEARPSVQQIAWAFAIKQYSKSPQEADTDMEEELDRAWKDIRGGLLAQVFRRLTPGGIQRR